MNDSTLRKLVNLIAPCPSSSSSVGLFSTLGHETPDCSHNRNASECHAGDDVPMETYVIRKYFLNLVGLEALDPSLRQHRMPS